MRESGSRGLRVSFADLRALMHPRRPPRAYVAWVSCGKVEGLTPVIFTGSHTFDVGTPAG